MDQDVRRICWLAMIALIAMVLRMVGPAGSAFFSIAAGLGCLAIVVLGLRLRRPRDAGFWVDINDLPHPLFVKDSQGRYVAVNRSLQDILGLRGEEIVGKHTTDLTQSDFAERHLAADQALLRDGGMQQYESTFLLASGEPRTYLFSKSAYPAVGPVTGTIGSFVDVTAQKDVERRLADSEAAYRNIVEAANEGIWVIDRAGMTTFVNARMASMLGYTVEQFNGRSMYDFMDDASRIEAEMNLQRRSEGIDDIHDFRFQHKDGSNRWFIIATKVLTTASGDFNGALGMLTDITARKSAEQALAAAQQELEMRVALRTQELQHSNRALQQRQKAIDASSHAVVIVTVDGATSSIDYANQASGRITGVHADQAIGKQWDAVFRIDMSLPEARKIQTALAGAHDENAIVQLMHGDGSTSWCHLYVSVVPDADASSRTFVFAAYDITSVRQYEERLDRLANFDPLTGLANISMLEHRIGEAILLSGQQDTWFHVAFIDIDRFRIVNQSLGKELGDRLLQEIGARLVGSVGPADTVARVGSDQFAVLLLVGAHGYGDVAGMAARMQAAIAQPITVVKQQVRLTASIGVASFPAHATVAQTLLERAQIAMGQAKHLGRGGFSLYESAMGDDAMARMEIEVALADAVGGKAFYLQYQPKVDIASRRTVGFEALMRWRSVELGQVSPVRFIPLLEETGDIIEVGNDVLRKACIQAQQWNCLSHTAVHISVNLSARQFADVDLARRVEQALDESGLEPQHLILEITESALVSDIEQAIRTMTVLRGLGVGLSIDDFGTGYSSLGYLKRFPLTELKIDQSFVRDILTEAEDALIVTSVINLARDMHLHVVAEGVETRAQLQFLEARGCHTAQGYLFSRPLDADQILFPGFATAVLSPLA